MARSPWQLLPRSLPLWMLLACGPEPTQTPSPAELLVDGETVISHVVDDRIGGVPLTARVRALNRFGAAVPSEPLPLQLDGAPVEVRFDATGYGKLVLDTPTVTEVSTSGGTAVLQALPTDWPGFGANRAVVPPLETSQAAVAVTTGALVAQGSEVWWAGADGTAHRVLDAGGEIRGLRARRIDVDDVLDGIAWTDDTVFLLRGRKDGGMAWGAAFTASRYTVGGADVADLNGDNLPDLAIAWASGVETSLLDVWHGDGLFGFTAAEPRKLPAQPTDLSIGDNTAEGRNQITVLDAEGSWSRFLAGTETQYIPIGPGKPAEFLFEVGSTLDADGDMNADRGHELWIYGPRHDGAPRSVQIVDLKGQMLEFVPWNPTGAWLARADGDGNELLDLFAAQSDGTLHSLTFEPGSNAWIPRKVAELPEHGPIALADWLQDRAPDLFLAGAQAWRFFLGVNAPGDPNFYWGVTDPGVQEVGASDGRIDPVELDGDPTTLELLTYELRGTSTHLVVQQGSPGAAELTPLGEVELVSNVAAVPLDVAVCDRDAYVLVGGKLVRVRLSNPSSPSASRAIDTPGSRVACGEGPDGSTVALLEGGTIELLNANLGSVGSVPEAGAVDIAVGDVGDGPEVRSCATPDCRITWWPWGPSGEASFVVAAAGVLSDELGEIGRGAGEFTVQDVDADDLPDLLLTAPGGVITLVRSAGVGPGLAEHYHLMGPSGPVVAGDADGDGHADLWFVDGKGRVFHTVQPWTPPDPEEPADPGTPTDTGS